MEDRITIEVHGQGFGDIGLSQQMLQKLAECIVAAPAGRVRVISGSKYGYDAIVDAEGGVMFTRGAVFFRTVIPSGMDADYEWIGEVERSLRKLGRVERLWKNDVQLER